MTPRCGVRAALTEERSKAEIKTSALRFRDETKSSYPHQKSTSSDRSLSIFTSHSSLFTLLSKLVD